MSRTASSGQQGIQPGSHYAPYSVHTRRDFKSASMQAGSNTSPGLLASVVAGSHGEERPRNSLPHRPFLLQFAIDVAAVLFAFLFVAVTGFGLAFAVFWFLFV